MMDTEAWYRITYIDAGDCEISQRDILAEDIRDAMLHWSKHPVHPDTVKLTIERLPE